jgi:molybdenum cofactor cytidylyltransferase
VKRIAGVVLVAGGSVPPGEPKQPSSSAGRAAHRAARAVSASRCDDVLVVVGAHTDAVSRQLEDRALTVLVNDRWSEGLSTSVHAGVRAAMALRHPEVDAVVLVLADQPAVSAQVIDRLIEALDAAPVGLVAAQYGGTLGSPALFARPHFAALLSLAGDRGAKSILLAHEADVVAVSFPEGELDIDTPADLERSRSRKDAKEVKG